MNKIIVLAAMGTLTLASLTACSGTSSPGTSSAASSSSGSCTPAHPNLKTAKTGTLTVATYNFPPFTQISGSTLSGAEGAVINAVAKAECLSVTVQPLDTGSVVAAAQTGRADLAAGNWYCTAARQKVVNLAGPVYTDQIGIISSDGAKTFDALKGKQMGTVDGYLWNDEFKKLYGGDLKVYPTPTAMYTDLRAGRIQVAADSFGSATYANQQSGNKYKVVVPEASSAVAASEAPPQVCFPMSKSNQALSDAVTADLEKMRTDGTLGKDLASAGLSSSAAETGALKLIS